MLRRPRCKSCGSENQRQLEAEINIHFPLNKALENPAVLVFRDLLVCLNCGFTEFTILEADLQKLTKYVA
jgi:hypothetical protein